MRLVHSDFYLPALHMEYPTLQLVYHLQLEVNALQKSLELLA